MTRSVRVLATAIGAIVLVVRGAPIGASELLAQTDVARADIRVPAYCGPCGCLHVTYEHHRELLSTYGLGFDPRNYDTTQPHYYFGRVRAYPRYFVDDWPTGSSC